MTASQIRGSKRIAINGQCGTDCVDGFVPVVEGFHAKMCLLRVFWEHIMYNSSSIIDCYFISSSQPHKQT